MLLMSVVSIVDVHPSPITYYHKRWSMYETIRTAVDTDNDIFFEKNVSDATVGI